MESVEELKSLLMRMEEESEKASLKSTLKKKKNYDHGNQYHQVMASRWRKIGTKDRFYYLGLQNHMDGDYSHGIKIYLFLGWKESYDKPRQHMKYRDNTL